MIRAAQAAGLHKTQLSIGDSLQHARDLDLMPGCAAAWGWNPAGGQFPGDPAEGRYASRAQLGERGRVPSPSPLDWSLMRRVQPRACRA